LGEKKGDAMPEYAGAEEKREGKGGAAMAEYLFHLLEKEKTPKRE